MDLKESAILGDAVADHWYYRSKAKAVTRTLGTRHDRRTIDVGSGSGYFAHRLQQTGHVGSVACVDPEYRFDEEVVMPDGHVLERHRSLETVPAGADLALLMDVLEHVDDDHALLAETVTRVRPGGRVLITVPAFQWLWSGHDEFLDHRRRYTLSQVEALAARAGLTVDRGHYFFGALFPVAAVQRLVSRVAGSESGSQLRDHSRFVHRLLERVCAAETRLQRFNRLAGLSVVVLARRPDDS